MPILYNRYAVIGNPIAHSLSPVIHRLFAQQTNQKITYSAILAPIDGFVARVQAFQRTGGKGLNITAPFKEDAFKLAGSLTEYAQEARAVNTLCFDQDGSIVGDNTDGRGFIEDVYENHGGCFEQKRVLFLGAGGAVRGLLPSMMRHNPASVVIANRTLAKAKNLAAQFVREKIPVSACAFSDLGQMPFDWIINGATQHLDAGIIPPQCFSENTGCYDLSYGSPNAFLAWAKQNGAAHCLDGLGLLVEQAALSFYIWRGVKPKTKVILEKLRQL